MATVNRVVGVDFSGAAQAGHNIWLAELSVRHRRPKLLRLDRLGDLCGDCARTAALGHLVSLILQSQGTLWAIDFPFGLPIEVPGGAWARQFKFLRQFGDDAYQAGLECVRIARSKNLPIHTRRQCDIEARTPFDCYHYRIIYQTFFGMRDVLGPLRIDACTAILPFQYAKLPTAHRVVVEACPGSTLKRLSLPHQNYKQPAGGPLTPKRRATRKLILKGIQSEVDISVQQVRTIMRNPGGDALDAVIAAVGSWHAYLTWDHAVLARHPRYRQEGKVFF